MPVSSNFLWPGFAHVNLKYVLVSVGWGNINCYKPLFDFFHSTIFLRLWLSYNI